MASNGEIPDGGSDVAELVDLRHVRRDSVLDDVERSREVVDGILRAIDNIRTEYTSQLGRLVRAVSEFMGAEVTSVDLPALSRAIEGFENDPVMIADFVMKAVKLVYEEESDFEKARSDIAGWLGILLARSGLVEVSYPEYGQNGRKKYEADKVYKIRVRLGAGASKQEVYAICLGCDKKTGYHLFQYPAELVDESLRFYRSEVVEILTDKPLLDVGGNEVPGQFVTELRKRALIGLTKKGEGSYYPLASDESTAPTNVVSILPRLRQSGVVEELKGFSERTKDGGDFDGTGY